MHRSPPVPERSRRQGTLKKHTELLIAGITDTGLYPSLVGIRAPQRVSGCSCGQGQQDSNRDNTQKLRAITDREGMDEVD